MTLNTIEYGDLNVWVLDSEQNHLGLRSLLLSQLLQATLISLNSCFPFCKWG